MTGELLSTGEDFAATVVTSNVGATGEASVLVVFREWAFPYIGRFDNFAVTGRFGEGNLRGVTLISSAIFCRHGFVLQGNPVRVF